MAFNGNQIAVVGGDAVEVNNQIGKRGDEVQNNLIHINPFSLLEGDEEPSSAAEKPLGNGKKPSEERNGKKPFSSSRSTADGRQPSSKPQRSFDREKGRGGHDLERRHHGNGRINGVNRHRQNNGVGPGSNFKESNGYKKHQEFKGESEGAGVNGESSEGWVVIGRRRNGNKQENEAPRRVRMHFGQIRSNIFVRSNHVSGTRERNNGNHQSDEVKAPFIRERNNGARRESDRERNNGSDHHEVKPTFKDEQSPQAAAQISADTNNTSAQKYDQDHEDAVAASKRRAEKIKRWKEDQKLMTLKVYEEKQLEDKRKIQESLKTSQQVRVATLDKDFESMRILEKKKQDSILNSENEKVKKKKVAMDKNGSDLLLTSSKPARTSNNRGRSRDDFKSVERAEAKPASYEDLFPPL